MRLVTPLTFVLLCDKDIYIKVYIDIDREYKARFR